MEEFYLELEREKFLWQRNPEKYRSQTASAQGSGLWSFSVFGLRGLGMGKSKHAQIRVGK